MTPFVAVTSIFGAGALAGWGCHRIWAGFWAASTAAAALATTVWIAGILILFWITAPNELGSLLPGPIFLTFLATLGSASVVGLWVRRRRSSNSE